MDANAEQSRSSITLEELEPCNRQSTTSPDTQHCLTSQASTNPVKRPRLINRLLNGWWTMELVSMSLALIVFALYLHLLKTYDGSKYFLWDKNPLSIPFRTLQSGAAFMITLLRVFMLYPVVAAMGQLKWHYFRRPTSRPVSDFIAFDDASKGIYGSVQLLLSRKAFHSLSVGCILLIGSLFLGLLTQNTIVLESIKTWENSSSNSSSMSWAFLPFSAEYGRAVKTDKDGLYANMDATAGMQAAILGGWSYYQNQERNTNPQYGDFEINTLPINCSTKACEWTNVTTLAVGHSCITTSIERKSKDIVVSIEGNINNNMGSEKRMSILNLQARPEVPENSTFASFANNRSIIVHLAALARGKEPNTFEAAECILYWEVHLIGNASYNATTLQHLESVTGRYNLTKLGPNPHGDEGNITIEAPCNPYNDGEKSCQYIVSARAHHGIRNFLTQVFKGYVYRDDSTNNSVIRSDDVITKLFALSYTRSIDEERPLLKVLRAYTTNAAISITRNIRTASEGLMPGRVYKEEIHYVIDWKYIIYPGVMLALSMYVFFLGIWRTRDIPVWKGSSLPILYHGFENPVLSQEELSNLAWLEEASKQKYVLLREYTDGLGLKLRDA